MPSKIELKVDDFELTGDAASTSLFPFFLKMGTETMVGLNVKDVENLQSMLNIALNEWKFWEFARNKKDAA